MDDHRRRRDSCFVLGVGEDQVVPGENSRDKKGVELGFVCGPGTRKLRCAAIHSRALVRVGKAMVHHCHGRGSDVSDTASSPRFKKITMDISTALSGLVNSIYFDYGLVALITVILTISVVPGAVKKGAPSLFRSLADDAELNRSLKRQAMENEKERNQVMSKIAEATASIAITLARMDLRMENVERQGDRIEKKIERLEKKVA